MNTQIGNWFRLLLAFAFTTTALAAEFKPGDQIKLTCNVDLMFRDQPFRSGKEGETFDVLAYRPDSGRVYLSAKDGNGQTIAVSIPQDAAALVPPTGDSLLDKALVAIEGKNIAQAGTIVDLVLQTDPTNARAKEIKTDIEAVINAQNVVKAATANLTTIQADVNRRRRNASVADRPNPLLRADNSNQVRARQMRDEADTLEKSAKDELSNAQTALTDATAKLASMHSSSAGLANSGATAATKPVLTGGGSFDYYWNDPYSEPPAGLPLNPSVADTLAFIQNKLSSGPRFGTIGFGTNSHLVIIRIQDIYSSFVLAFDPADINPQVKTYTGEANDIIFGRREHGCVRLECTNPRHSLLVFGSDGMILPITDSLLSRNHYSSYDIAFPDRIIADKVAKAFSNLAQIYGAKADPF